MTFETLRSTDIGQTKGFASRTSGRACALIALALLGCGSEAAETGADTAPTGTTPSTSTGTAGSAAPSTPSTTTTKPDTQATTPATNTGTTTTAPSTTPPASSGMTPPAMAGTGNTPATSPTTPPANTTPMMGTDPAGAAGAPATPMTGAMLPVETGTPTLFWLQIETNAVYTAGAPDGAGQKSFATGRPLSAPDGIAVDPKGGWVYVLNMGTVLGGSNSGSMVRYKLDGSSPETIMPAGSMADGETFNTGKQLSIDKVNSKLYLGDREGAKVWRTDLEGKNLEVLVSGHGILQIVGVAPDPIAKQFYFSDRNGKKLFRANIDMPAGKTHADRDDVELIYVDKAANAMPLDIELDVEERIMYWTDRQQNKVFSMPMDMPAGSDAMTRTDVKTVASGLTDVIGLGFDHENKMLYATHSGTVSSFKADGSGTPQRIGSNGRTGLAFTKIP